MSDIENRIERLEEKLAKATEQLGGLEKVAASTDRSLSRRFTERMNEAIHHRDHLEKKLQELRREKALNWSPVDSRIGLLQVCDEIGHRLDELMHNLDSPDQ